MNKLTPLIPLLTVCLAATAYAERWTPSETDISEVEASISLDRLPGWNNRYPTLTGYQRFYSGSTRKGGRVILAEFVEPLSPTERPGVHIVASQKDFPVIFDGGCTLINLVYSVKHRELLSISCNLEA